MSDLKNKIYNFSILDHSPIGMCVIDEDYNIVFWNQCLADWTNMNKNEIIGKNLLKMFPHFRQKKYKVRLDVIFKGGAPTIFSSQLHRYTFKAYLPDKELRIQHTTVRTIPSEISGKYYALFAVEDVTEMTHRIRSIKTIKDSAIEENQQRKIAEKKLQETLLMVEKSNQELKKKNIELDQFNYLASHDLQEPLRSLSAFSSLIGKDPESELSEKSRQYLRIISSASQKMRRLIENLLNLSKSSSKKMSITEFSVDICVDDAISALQLRIEESNAQIERQKLQTVTGDKILITQLYQNLIGNALKFKDQSTPQISLTIQNENENIIYGVKDNGIGVSPEYIESIFEPFKRGKSTKEVEGSGIGLAICRKIVERHNGNIWVESQPGKGTHFKFTLGSLN